MDMDDIYKMLIVGTSIKRKRPPSIVSSSTDFSTGNAETAAALDFFGDNKRQDVAVLDEQKPISRKRSAEDDTPSSSPKKKKRDAASTPEPTESPTGKSSKKKKKKSSEQQQQELVAAQREKANAVRNQHEISVRGTDIPDCVESFDEMQTLYNFPPYLLPNIRKSGYSSPTPVQMQAVPLMMMHREVLVCAPTGSGKTAAFLLPLLAHLKEPKRDGFRALVVAPTRELSRQTFRELSRLCDGSGFRVHVLTKATSSSFGASSSQRFDILVSTPNRLVHLLEQDPSGIDLSAVQWLVLDEADKLFEKGKESFEEQISTVLAACTHGQCCRALFSATLGNGIEDWCQGYLANYTRIIVGQKGAGAGSINQQLKFVGQEYGKILEMRMMVKRGMNLPVLVFVQSKDRAKALFKELVYDDMRVDVIHSDRTQAQRDSIISAFRAGKIWILICTELMSRGIDFKGVNTVINYDFPTSAVDYIHRIGRTGRAGRSGDAITFFTESDFVNLRSIVNVMVASGCEVPEWMLQLKKPSKRDRKKLRQKPTERKTPSSMVKHDITQAKKKREMIAASKKRKQRAAEEA
ncbi:probable ATP-dependent RNA helicase DDX52 [Sycon ciliatum]|uniref:probable ATP-dependent RNA helicase DDX52 n=1 Tax=Sycon ciliatum TaxID=27933 RepID=UPI0031F6056D